ncbi:hypothetical protein [Leptospira stimsonii]|uniref:NAD(P)-dependent oxidoreductase n=1 Tax=Leptospira stimsonii TaxID=2202203 RepID=A0A396YPG1_9LEPT|nr:hypothetical protein [Leptospira stimsonii]RHX83953.1 hypothetical protein DLM75_23355 [Leptospira stimsonii]
MRNVAVFGLGYAGKRISEKLQTFPELSFRSFSSKTRIAGTENYDFTEPDSLASFSKRISPNEIDLSIVTFPIQKLNDPSLFLDVLFLSTKNSILLGTTSIYRRDPDIVESTPLVADHERFAIEEEWLQRGGKILRLCGIYGPGRNPADWARKGLVKKNSRQLNLIHGDDIAQAVVRLTQYIREKSFESIPNILNLSDNQWHTWKEIFSFLEEHGKIPKSEIVESEREDTFVDSGLIRNLLPDLQTKDFWTELENLEGISDL